MVHTKAITAFINAFLPIDYSGVRFNERLKIGKLLMMRGLHTRPSSDIDHTSSRRISVIIQ